MKRGLLMLVLFAAIGTAWASKSEIARDQRQSGAAFMSPSTQAMQGDDTQNPAMLWVGDGEALWRAPPDGGGGAGGDGSRGKSCADCHADAKKSMRGVAARYPAFDASLKLPLNLAGRINQCRQTKQHLAPLPAESRELLSLESYLAYQSRGMPVAPPKDPRLKQPTARGKQYFFRRIGQLNLSCAQCHNDNWGKRLAGSPIPQGHANAYPIYRLEWQNLGSLQRRLRNCMSGVRAEVPAYGAQELVELELYLAARAAGMVLESPGVRP
jgi:sulfur-oxidizing protein SoxA